MNILENKNKFYKISVMEYIYRKKFSKKEFYKDITNQTQFINNLNSNRGEELLSKVDTNYLGSQSRKLFFRFLLKQMYQESHPYIIFLKGGFDKFIIRIDSDEKQLLSESGLLNIENDDVLNWWSDLKKIIRSKELDNKIESGEFGEIASKKFEEKRIKNLGINNLVKRSSFYDESLGYDIESWNIKNNKIFNIYIEVKNNSFIFKSGQWREACSKKDLYYAHYWTRNCKYLKIIEFPELHKAVTQQINKEHPPGYEWTLKIPFSEGKPVEEYFNNF